MNNQNSHPNTKECVLNTSTYAQNKRDSFNLSLTGSNTNEDSRE